MSELPYYLVKITDKKWADTFQKGQLYMRSISCFGDLTRRDDDADNNFRGDVLEGFSQSFGDGHNPYGYIKTDDGINEIAPDQVGVIDVLTLREKILCLYALEYDEKDGFVLPDKRMAEFGDTAVIIADSDEFLRRVCEKMIEKYDNAFWTSFMRVSYDLDFTINQLYNEFSKSKHYEWQKEFRIALDLTQGRFDKRTLEDITDFAKLTFPGKIEEDTNPDSIADSLTLDIGSIEDITMSVPVEDFIKCENIIPFLPETYPPTIIRSLDIPRPSRPTFFRLVRNLQ